MKIEMMYKCLRKWQQSIFLRVVFMNFTCISSLVLGKYQCSFHSFCCHFFFLQQMHLSFQADSLNKWLFNDSELGDILARKTLQLKSNFCFWINQIFPWLLDFNVNIYTDASWLRMGLYSDKPIVTWKYLMSKMYLLLNCSVSFVYPHVNMADWELWWAVLHHCPAPWESNNHIS